LDFFFSRLYGVTCREPQGRTIRIEQVFIGTGCRSMVIHDKGFSLRVMGLLRRFAFHISQIQVREFSIISGSCIIIDFLFTLIIWCYGCKKKITNNIESTIRVLYFLCEFSVHCSEYIALFPINTNCYLNLPIKKIPHIIKDSNSVDFYLPLD
jgi:hypothetical protein